MESGVLFIAYSGNLPISQLAPVNYLDNQRKAEVLVFHQVTSAFSHSLNRKAITVTLLFHFL